MSDALPPLDRAKIFTRIARVQELCEAMTRSGEFQPTARYRDGSILAHGRVVEDGRAALKELAELFGETPRQLLAAASGATQ
jgi:hypothetical protein